MVKTFSEREKVKQKPNTYQYDEIPERLREKILYVLEDVITSVQEREIFVRGWHTEWESVWDIYCRKKGLPAEVNNPKEAQKECRKIIRGNDIGATFDIIEIALHFMTKRNTLPNKLKKTVGEATNELNDCFREESFGYQVKRGKITRVDSAHIDHEVIEPALDFLQGSEFESANKEFLSAQEHYRNGRYRDCITNANAAFESVMKIICDNEKWKYDKGTVYELVETLSKRDRVIPNYLKSYFNLGLSTLRNKQSSAHGQGNTRKTDECMAGYALHLAATNILFLMQRTEIYKNQPRMRAVNA